MDKIDISNKHKRNFVAFATTITDNEYIFPYDEIFREGLMT